MAGTIAPARLLGTLKVLLSPSGGINSHQEVSPLSITVNVVFVKCLSTLLISYFDFKRDFEKWFISGWTPRIIDAEVFKETRV